jgi:hypothetical protein
MRVAIFTGAAVACFAAVTVSAQTTVSVEDRAEIQALVSDYAGKLFACDAEGFADLFVADSGYFASGFRGHMAGHERLTKLVESERHCAPGTEPTNRPGGQGGPVVTIDVTPVGVFGLADLGTAEYQDEYARTPAGWKFQSRTVIIAAEKAAGLDAAGLLAIHRLGGDGLGDHFESDDNGRERLIASGVAVSVAGDRVTGRAWLNDGGYNDMLYEQLASGEWRVVSSTHVP